MQIFKETCLPINIKNDHASFYIYTYLYRTGKIYGACLLELNRAPGQYTETQKTLVTLSERREGSTILLFC
jgi:hypothetical protein